MRREGLPAISLADPIRDLLVGPWALPPTPKPPLLGGGGVRVRFRFAATKETKYERNVVGLFPGSDPEKKKEIIIYSAHYDHVGVDEKGEIFNGSDDNASGTSSLLEIAEAFGQAPGRREAWRFCGSRAKRKVCSAATGSPIT